MAQTSSTSDALALPPPRAGESNFGARLRRFGIACQAACGALCEPLPQPAATVQLPAGALPHADDDPEEVLRMQIDEARHKVKALQATYTATICKPLPPWSPDRGSPEPRRPVKMFIDGVFDLMHFGHMNAFRLARSLGNYLIVGVNSDESVRRCKGTVPILNDEERQIAVKACRFVDEIVPASPYVMSAAYIDELTEKYGIDYFVHGDDPCIVDGKDVYEGVKKAGRFRSIPRTEGVSTTDILGRTLLLTKEHHKELVDPGDDGREAVNKNLPACVSQQSKFLVTSQLVRAFSASLPKTIQKTKGRIVYVDGAWDMFHGGHISLLSRARALGDSLIVGVHSDAVVNQQRGFNYPILAMNERVLSVMGCRYCDDVLIDAPWHITQEMVSTLGISVVVRGATHDCADSPTTDPRDPHEVPIKLGIHKEIESGSTVTVGDIVARLQASREEAQARLAVKHEKERAWYCEKHGLKKSDVR